MLKRLSLVVLLLLSFNAQAAETYVPYLDPLIDYANSSWAQRALFVAGGAVVAGAYTYANSEGNDASLIIAIDGGGTALANILFLNAHWFLTENFPKGRSIISCILLLAVAYKLAGCVEELKYEHDEAKRRPYLRMASFISGGLLAAALSYAYNEHSKPKSWF